MKQSTDIFISIKRHVVCIDPTTGAERWRTKVKRSSIMPVVDTGDLILCYAGGHLFGIDRSTGAIKWENKLPQLGHGYCLIAGDSAQQAAQTAIAQAIAAQAAAASAG